MTNRQSASVYGPSNTRQSPNTGHSPPHDRTRYKHTPISLFYRHAEYRLPPQIHGCSVHCSALTQGHTIQCITDGSQHLAVDTQGPETIPSPAQPTPSPPMHTWETQPLPPPHFTALAHEPFPAYSESRPRHNPRSVTFPHHRLTVQQFSVEDGHPRHPADELEVGQVVLVTEARRGVDL